MTVKNEIRGSKEKQALELAIGGISFRFQGMDRELMRLSDKTYGLFNSRSGAADHSASVSRPEPREPLPADDLLLGSEAGTGRAVIAAPYFRGSACGDFSEGTLEIFSCPNAEYDEKAVENYIRWVTANILMKTGAGLLLHASASVVEGAAHVFLGPHGSGKSTASSLTKNGFIIADDVLPVLMKNGKAVAAAMPAVGKFPQEAENTGSYPVKSFYWLIKSERNRIVRVGRPQAAGLLMASAPFISGSAGSPSGLFPQVLSLLESVPMYNLHFRKEEGFLRDACEAFGKDRI